MTSVAGLSAPYLVIGCSAAGMSAATALSARAGPGAVRVWEQLDVPHTRARADRLVAAGIEVDLGAWRPALLDHAVGGTVVKSPGVAAQTPAVQQALARQLTVVDEVEVGRRLTDRRLVGVTGTDGKSTVCGLLAHLFGVGAPAPIAGNTEFGPPLSSVDPTGGPVVVELSSYQLEFLPGPFTDLAVLTNISREHLHRHGTMDAYATAKSRLFLSPDGARVVPLAVLPADDRRGRELAGQLRGAGSRVATFGLDKASDYRILELDFDIDGSRILVATPAGKARVCTRLAGAHNALNAAAVLAAGDLWGTPRASTEAVLARFPGVPGRWERIVAGQPFEAIVDFALTEASVRAVLTTARDVLAGRPGSRLHVVLGGAGGIYPDKRRPMAQIAGDLSDRLLITLSAPRGEAPGPILDALIAGAEDARAQYEVILDRREAIRLAVAGADPGDLVMLLDRGARPTLQEDAAGGGVPFDDRAVLREELAAAGFPGLRHPLRPG